MRGERSGSAWLSPPPEGDEPLLAADEEEGGGPGGATVVESALNLMAAILGAGMLGLPYCFRESGFLLAWVQLLFAIYCGQRTMDYLILAAPKAKCTYEGVAEEAVGLSGRQWVSIGMVLMQFGCLVAYLNILGDVSAEFVRVMFFPHLGEEKAIDRTPLADKTRPLLMAVMALCVVLPLGFTSNVKKLASSSTISVVFMMTFVLFICLRAFDPAPGELEAWVPSGVPVAFPIICFAFQAHTALYTVYGGLARPSTARMVRSSRLAMYSCLMLYGVVGSLGYFAFGEETSGDILRNFSGAYYGTYAKYIKLIFGTSIVFTCPMSIFVLRSSLLPFITGSPKVDVDSVPRRVYNTVTVGIVVSALVAALYVPNLEFVFGLTGSTSTVLLTFVFPPIIYLRLGKRDLQPLRTRVSGPGVYEAYAFMALGALVFVVCTSAVIGEVNNEQAVVQLAQELADSAEAADTESGVLVVTHPDVDALDEEDIERAQDLAEELIKEVNPNVNSTIVAVGGPSKNITVVVLPKAEGGLDTLNSTTTAAVNGTAEVDDDEGHSVGESDDRGHDVAPGEEEANNGDIDTGGEESGEEKPEERAGERATESGDDEEHNHPQEEANNGDDIDTDGEERAGERATESGDDEEHNPPQ